MHLPSVQPLDFENVTREDAQVLFATIDRARQRIVREIASIGRSRLPDPDKAKAVALLRLDLATFEALAAALGEAHDLGGY